MSAHKKSDPICLQCSVAFRPKSNIALDKAKFCSPECKNKFRRENPTFIDSTLTLQSYRIKWGISQQQVANCLGKSLEWIERVEHSNSAIGNKLYEYMDACEEW